MFSVWPSTVQKNGGIKKKMKEEQKFNIILPLRPIPFLSLCFFCAWSQFIELARAAITAYSSLAMLFPLAFPLLLSFFSSHQRMENV
jgi:hypothetical protein